MASRRRPGRLGRRAADRAESPASSSRPHRASRTRTARSSRDMSAPRASVPQGRPPRRGRRRSKGRHAATPPTGSRSARTSRTSLVALAAEGRPRRGRREGRARDARRGARRAARCGPLRPPPHRLLRARSSSSCRRSSPARSSFGCSCGSASRARCRCGGRTRGSSSPVLSLGDGAESRRAAATAKAALRRGGTLSLLGGRTLRSALVRRFQAPCAAIVARVGEPVARADAYLAATAVAMSVDLRARAPARALGRARARCSSAPASSG